MAEAPQACVATRSGTRWAHRDSSRSSQFTELADMSGASIELSAHAGTSGAYYLTIRAGRLCLNRLGRVRAGAAGAAAAERAQGA